MTHAEFTVTEKRVVGLELADGTQIWPPHTWHGRPIETSQDRRIITDALTISAQNAGIPNVAFYNHFRWLVKVEKTYTSVVDGEVVTLPIDDPDLIAPPFGTGDGESVVDAEVIDTEATNLYQ